MVDASVRQARRPNHRRHEPQAFCMIRANQFEKLTDNEMGESSASSNLKTWVGKLRCTTLRVVILDCRLSHRESPLLYLPFAKQKSTLLSRIKKIKTYPRRDSCDAERRTTNANPKIESGQVRLVGNAEEIARATLQDEVELVRVLTIRNCKLTFWRTTRSLPTTQMVVCDNGRDGCPQTCNRRVRQWLS